MTKTFCDRCGKEISDVNDILTLAVTKGRTNKLARPVKEICVFCFEELRPMMEGEK